jgi:hypothetical protein
VLVQVITTSLQDSVEAQCLQHPQAPGNSGLTGRPRQLCGECHRDLADISGLKTLNKHNGPRITYQWRIKIKLALRHE